jgi:hypothetical protein
MRTSSTLAAFLLIPSIALGSACKPVTFINPMLVRPDYRQLFPIQVGSMLQLAVPTGFEGMVFSGHSTVIGYPNKAIVVIGVETKENFAMHRRGAQPGPFYREVYTGTTSQACKHLASTGLAEQDFRIQIKSGELDVFAYGKASHHEAVVIHPEKPHTVVRLRFSGVTREVFESVISTIRP